MKRYLLISIALAAWSCGSAFAAGTTGAQFLKISVGARPAAMGGAGATLGGVESVFYNPAGLVEVQEAEATFSQTAWVRDVGYSNLAAAKKFRSLTLGVAAQYLSVPSINRYNNFGMRLGNYTMSDAALGFSCAANLNDALALGGTLRYISSAIDDVRAGAFAVDLGARYAFEPSVFEAGLVVQNLGTALTYVSESTSLPLNAKAGVSYRLPIADPGGEQGILIASDVNFLNDTGFYGNLGLELFKDYGDQGHYALRLGYRTNLPDSVNGVSLGLGVLFKDYSLDYGFSPLGELGQAHRVSLSVKLGDAKSY